MSTYLVFVCVGEYDYVESSTNDGIKLRVYTVPGKKNQAQVALVAGGMLSPLVFPPPLIYSNKVKSLEMFTEWFGVKYPLPKLDLLAIPDFSAGAMVIYSSLCNFNWSNFLSRKIGVL